MYDQNRPSTYLNTAYEAMKFNPQQTNQVISAASQGAPVGLAGLAAMMAKQNQQAAQPPMQAPHQSILQQMAQMQGIAGQFPAAVQLAHGPSGPPGMAGGGLVAFADGGSPSLDEVHQILSEDPRVLPREPSAPIPHVPKAKPHPEARAAGYKPQSQNIPEGADQGHSDAVAQPASLPIPPDPAESGLGALNMREAAKEIEDLYGHRTLNPETTKQLQELKSQASRSTLFDSLLGAMKGLANPWGGRFAVADAAAGMLGAHQNASSHEQSLAEKEFEMMQGYRDAPLTEHNRAVDALLKQLTKSGELQSAERVAGIRGSGSGQTFAERSALQTQRDMAALERARLMSQGKGESTEAQMMNARVAALKQVEEDNKAAQQDVSRKFAPLTEEEKMARYNEYMKRLTSGLDTAGGYQGYSNLGSGSNLPRITPTGIIQPQ